MRQIIPLRRAVVLITNEASAGDDEGIRKTLKSWYNRLSIGSIPRTVVTKLGRELFLDLEAWEEWLAGRAERTRPRGPGRPRTS
jgi:hypothetical protein